MAAELARYEGWFVFNGKVFVTIPKNASRVFKPAFKRCFDRRGGHKKLGGDYFSGFSRNAPGLEGLVRYTMLRDPVTRFLSAFHSPQAARMCQQCGVKARHCDEEQVLELARKNPYMNKHFCPQSYFAENAEVIGVLEEGLEVVWGRMQALFDIDEKLPRRDRQHSSLPRGWKEWQYEKEMAEAIEDVYAEDVALYEDHLIGRALQVPAA